MYIVRPEARCFHRYIMVHIFFTAERAAAIKCWFPVVYVFSVIICWAWKSSLSCDSKPYICRRTSYAWKVNNGCFHNVFWSFVSFTRQANSTARNGEQGEVWKRSKQHYVPYVPTIHFDNHSQHHSNLGSVISTNSASGFTPVHWHKDSFHPKKT